MQMGRHMYIKFLTCYLSMVLVCLFCVLSSLDAPEYVRCGHIGVCEFLELSGDLVSGQRAEDAVAVMMSRYINPYRYQDILTPPACERIIEVDHNQEYIPLLIQKKCLPLQTLQIITTTIIKS